MFCVFPDGAINNPFSPKAQRQNALVVMRLDGEIDDFFTLSLVGSPPSVPSLLLSHLVVCLQGGAGVSHALIHPQQ